MTRCPIHLVCGEWPEYPECPPAIGDCVEDACPFLRAWVPRRDPHASRAPFYRAERRRKCKVRA